MPRCKLCDFLDIRYPLSTGLRTLLESKETINRRILKKGHFLLMPKMDVDEMHYLVSGLCKAYWLNEDNEEEIFLIWPQDSWVMLPEEFFAGLKNTCCYIVLMEESEVLTFTKDQVDMINSAYTEWQMLMDLIRMELMAMRNRQLKIMMRKEGDRYGLFCELFPEQLRLRLTDKEIRAYTGISRSTLSAAKREMALRKQVPKNTHGNA